MTNGMTNTPIYTDKGVYSRRRPFISALQGLMAGMSQGLLQSPANEAWGNALTLGTQQGTKAAEEANNENAMYNYYTNQYKSNADTLRQKAEMLGNKGMVIPDSVNDTQFKNLSDILGTSFDVTKNKQDQEYKAQRLELERQKMLSGQITPEEYTSMAKGLGIDTSSFTPSRAMPSALVSSYLGRMSQQPLDKARLEYYNLRNAGYPAEQAWKRAMAENSFGLRQDAFGLQQQNQIYQRQKDEIDENDRKIKQNLDTTLKLRDDERRAIKDAQSQQKMLLDANDGDINKARNTPEWAALQKKIDDSNLLIETFSNQIQNYGYNAGGSKPKRKIKPIITTDASGNVTITSPKRRRQLTRAPQKPQGAKTTPRITKPMDF